jgi:hypothetical protein
MKIFDLKNNPIGAFIEMEDIKTKNKYSNYVSFGKYINNENGTDCDSFGIDDMEIFHNFINEEDLKSCLNEEFTEDFKLLSYKPYYTNNNWQKIKEKIKQYRKDN